MKYTLYPQLVFEGRDHHEDIPNPRRMPMRLLAVVTKISAFDFKSGIKNCYFINISFWFSNTQPHLTVFSVNTINNFLLIAQFNNKCKRDVWSPYNETKHFTIT